LHKQELPKESSYPESSSANREQQLVDGQPETKQNIAIIRSRQGETVMGSATVPKTSPGSRIIPRYNGTV